MAGVKMAAESGRDPLTQHTAREHSLEGVPESTGYVLFIPDFGGQGQERGHISDLLTLRRRGDHGTIQGERTSRRRKRKYVL
jgi:hypothetical protein